MMPAASLVAVGGFVLVQLLLAAALLWQCCRTLRLRREPSAGPTPGISPLRALVLTALAALLGGAAAAGLILIGGSLFDTPPAALLVAALLGLAAAPLPVLRFGLPATPARAAGVWLVWLVLGTAQALLAGLAGRALFFEVHRLPTGAMAETLLGPHKRIRCPRCGRSFAIDATAEATPLAGSTVRINGCVCPGCRAALPLAGPGESFDAELTIPDPGGRRADRVLAARGLLLSGWQPERFAPVVFRYPGPLETATGQGPFHIARLAGLPGERIALHRGDLWLLPAAEANLAAVAPAAGVARFGPDAESEQLFRAGRFRLVRKDPALALTLRRLVHDADRPVTGAPARWQPGGGWTGDGSGGFRLDHGETPLETAAELVYQHTAAAGRRSLITDHVGYNTAHWGRHDGPDRPAAENWQPDLHLECEVEVQQPSGSVTLGLARGPDRLLASFDVAAGSCILTRRRGDDTLEELGRARVPLLPGVPARLRLANVDERLIVWMDERLVFGDGVEYQPSGPLLPRPQTDLQPALVATTCARVQVRGLRLYADQYYTAARHGNPAEADDPAFRADDPATWPRLAGAVSAYRVEAGQYFVLGDNSPACSDSRLWGLLPAENLTGKVLFRISPLSRLGWVR